MEASSAWESVHIWSVGASFEGHPQEASGLGQLFSVCGHPGMLVMKQPWSSVGVPLEILFVQISGLGAKLVLWAFH